ncbi:serine/threonine-protein kinase 12-like isoform X2 [Primulina tabacum]|uniref:serine/threonine-protein kinase 12-like isoform X2 n=1 Tax=Primulina tabacum TaxID=48773 RepID=UPI003F5919F9
MDSKITPPVGLTVWKQSSMAPEPDNGFFNDLEGEHEFSDVNDIDPGLKLMYLANEGDLDGIKELLDNGADVNFRDIDHRTALHVATCQGYVDVAEFLLENAAAIDARDRWGSTMAPMHVPNAREIPEYEINPKELDFTNSVEITKGTYTIASWRGIHVAVKILWEQVGDEDKVRAFGDELALLQKIRHPNVVQFLGAVTQSSPMMIVTEYLSKGDLCEYLKRKGSIKAATSLRFAMDIARGMNYLHEFKPEAIIHCDLEPSNILRDDSGHLKVADFGVSKLLKVANRVKEVTPLTCQDTCRYVAPEVFRNEEYDTKVDVFSFALILQEMIEGCPPFSSKQDHEVAESHAANDRPPFKASLKLYAHGLKELIEECWSENPTNRPTFKQIIPRLEAIYNSFGHRRRWKVGPLKCFQKKDSSFGHSSRSDGSI